MKVSELSRDEKEFNINYILSDKVATISITASPNDKVYKKLDKMIKDYSDTYKIIDETKDEDGIPYHRVVTCPKNLAIGLRSPREKKELTEEQKIMYKERAKKMQAAKKNKSI